MGILIKLEKQHREQLTQVRPGEEKLGEKILTELELNDLPMSQARFVILGIPEDIGVRANRGKAGASQAWDSFLGAFLNLQNNRYLRADRIAILGKVDTIAEMRKAETLVPGSASYFEDLGVLVDQIDQKVSGLITGIVRAGKIPIIIGGGHNNALGNIEGLFKALNKKVNILNIDAHTDLRKTDLRHSGNGFSFAQQRGYLEKYMVFGLHRNYTPEYIYELIDQNPAFAAVLFENLSPELPLHFENALHFINGNDFGLEIDCDAIAGFPSSAKSSSGFSVEEIRHFIRRTSREVNCRYLHLCEASVQKDFCTGKTLSTFVADFIFSRS